MATIGEAVVEAIAWYATDPHGEMPTSLAEMSPRELERTMAALRRMIGRHGGDGAMDIAAAVAGTR